MIKKINIMIGKIIYQLKMFKHRPRLMWNSLYVRKDEFHSSLNLDVSAILDMNKEDMKKHIKDLCNRRQLAHDRDYRPPMTCVNIGKKFSEYLDWRFSSDSPYTGEKFRESFLQILDTPDAWYETGDYALIELDFLFVKRISPSWANEAFAYFRKYASASKILSKIKFSNISKTKMDIIKYEIKSGYYGE